MSDAYLVRLIVRRDEHDAHPRDWQWPEGTTVLMVHEVGRYVDPDVATVLELVEDVA